MGTPIPMLADLADGTGFRLRSSPQFDFVGRSFTHLDRRGPRPSGGGFAPLSGLQVAQFVVAERNAVNSRRFVAGRGEQPAEFAVLAFGQFHNQVRFSSGSLSDFHARCREPRRHPADA